MPARPRDVGERFVALVRADPYGLRAGFGALVVSAATGLIAGVILGSVTGTLERLPGLLILVPAAVGMRGNVFGALGSRLGTSVHAGTFRLSRRLDTLVGQNLAAAVVLSMALAVLLAVVAKGLALAFGVTGSISMADFVAVSVVGGLVPIVVVMAITVGVAALSVRRSWDLDNVAAPVVTAAADSVTLPSLVLATAVAGLAVVTPLLALAGGALGLGLLVLGWRSDLPVLRVVVRESVPILLGAGVVSMLAGVTLQKQLETLLRYPLLLVVVPPLLSLSGSLAGILAARLATKLHLGLVDPGRLRRRAIAEDVLLVYGLALGIFLVLFLAAEIVGRLLGIAGPPFLTMLGIVLLAGFLATTSSNGIGIYGALLTYRLGLDPDNYGIPLVSSASDLLGAISLILTLAIFGLA